MTEETAGTPRTDAALEAVRAIYAEAPMIPGKFVEFARQLEREVAALTTERDGAHAKLALAAEDAAGLEELLRSHQSGHSAATNALAKEMERTKALQAHLIDANAELSAGWQALGEAMAPGTDHIYDSIRQLAEDRDAERKRAEDAEAKCFGLATRFQKRLDTGTAQATECGTNGTELRAELDAAKRALAERDEALLEANNLLKYWKQVATEAEEEISRQVG